MPTFVCSVEACDNTKHYSKGMCRLHYRRTQPRKPDKPKMIDCIVCGTSVARHSGGYTRKIGATCSQECRNAITFGKKTELPTDHPARWYGTTCAWPKVKAHRPAPERTRTYSCAWCGKTATASRGDATYCTTHCKGKAKDVRRRGREHNAAGTYTYMELVRLWVAFDKACAYCAQPTALPKIQAEHVRPLSRGGRNDLSNLLPSCGPCNGDKRDVLLPDWNADRARRGLPPRATTWRSSDQRYKHLTIDFLTALITA